MTKRELELQRQLPEWAVVELDEMLFDVPRPEGLRVKLLELMVNLMRDLAEQRRSMAKPLRVPKSLGQDFSK